MRPEVLSIPIALGEDLRAEVLLLRRKISFRVHIDRQATRQNTTHNAGTAPETRCPDGCDREHTKAALRPSQTSQGKFTHPCATFVSSSPRVPAFPPSAFGFESAVCCGGPFGLSGGRSRARTADLLLVRQCRMHLGLHIGPYFP